MMMIMMIIINDVDDDADDDNDDNNKWCWWWWSWICLGWEMLLEVAIAKVTTREDYDDVEDDDLYIYL